MAGFIGIATTYIFGTLLTANGNLKQLNGMAFGGMLINIVLNLVLIQQMQALGAAYAALTTQILTAAAQVGIATYLFKLKINYLLIFKLTGFVLFSILAGKLTLFVDHWIFGFWLLIAAGFAYAFITRLISLKTLYLILKNDPE